MRRNPMKCPFHDEAVNAVLSYLRRSGKSVRRLQDGYVVAYGTPDIGIIEQAYTDGAISVQEDGSILICGVSIPNRWYTARIRRRIEDYLRKTASNKDIIRIAACLGLK